MMFLIPLVFFIFYTSFFVLLTKQSFGRCLMPAMLTSIFPYYFGQLIFGTFAVGFWINIVCCLVPVVVAFIKRRDKEFLKVFFDRVTSSGLMIFALIYMAFTLFDFNRALLGWDSFSHWGPMVKEMWRLDSFYCVPESLAAAHQDYPPAMQLFEYQWLRLTGSYNDHLLTGCVHILQFSILVPFIEKRKVRTASVKTALGQLLLTAVTVGCTYMVILLFDHHQVINTIYIDYFMALLLVYMLCHVLTEEKWSGFTVYILSVSGAFLLLTKQMGLPLWLMILFAFGVKTVREIKKKLCAATSRMALSTSLTIIIPFGIYESWKLYIKGLGIEEMYSPSDISIREAFSGTNEIVGAFKKAVFDRNLTSSSVFRINYVGAVVVLLLILLVLAISFRKAAEISKYYIALITLAIGTAGYAFATMCVYAFCFEKAEAGFLSSFDRYMSTFVLVIFGTIWVFVIEDVRRDAVINVSGAVIIVLSFILSDSRLYIVPAIKPGMSYYEKRADSLSPSEDGVIYVQTDDGNEFNALTYYLSPTEVQRTGQ